MENLVIKAKKNNIKLVIDKKEYDLHYSFRIYIIYESAVGRNLDFDRLTLSDLYILFYASIIATLQYNKIEHSLKYDELMNIIDECGGEYILTTFSSWFVDKMKQQAELLRESNEEVEEGKKKYLKKTKKETLESN